MTRRRRNGPWSWTALGDFGCARFFGGAGGAWRGSRRRGRIILQVGVVAFGFLRGTRARHLGHERNSRKKRSVNLRIRAGQSVGWLLAARTAHGYVTRANGGSGLPRVQPKFAPIWCPPAPRSRRSNFRSVADNRTVRVFLPRATAKLPVGSVRLHPNGGIARCGTGEPIGRNRQKQSHHKGDRGGFRITTGNQERWP